MERQSADIFFFWGVTNNSGPAWHFFGTVWEKILPIMGSWFSHMASSLTYKDIRVNITETDAGCSRSHNYRLGIYLPSFSKPHEHE